MEENIYRIEVFSEHGEYLWDSDFHFPFSGIHENELQKHERKIDLDDPLWFLRRVFLGEFGDVAEIVKKLETGDIVLRDAEVISYREYIESDWRGM